MEKEIVPSTDLDEESNHSSTSKTIDSLHDESSRDSFSEEEKKAFTLKRLEFKQKEKDVSIKNLKYLLQASKKYSSFCEEKINQLTKGTGTVEDIDQEPQAEIKISLKFFKNGELRPYQKEGVEWICKMYNYGLNGILADEMGLGKTIQIIAFICHLITVNVKGPFLIVCPFSTLPNWASEFKRFAPDIPVILYYGDKNERKTMATKFNKGKSVQGYYVKPVVLISYQITRKDATVLNQINWKYVVVDEGHCIKNPNAQLTLVLKNIPCLSKLVLTGTPLQNSIEELWALLNYLMPKIFSKIDCLTGLFALENMADDNMIIEEEKSNNIITSVHRVLAPFMLRRLKKDVLTDGVPKKEMIVYCPLSELQKKLYTYYVDFDLKKIPRYSEEFNEDVLAPPKKRYCKGRENDWEAYRKFETPYEKFLTGEEKRTGKPVERELAPYFFKLNQAHFYMQLREIINHPYIIHHPEENSGYLVSDERLISSSGKMIVLDKMLIKLKEGNHKVLIFSSFIMMLDIIEDFLKFKEYEYSRIDGTRDLADRQENIAKFNEGNTFVFLITTRAGGLGLNLTAADTVIIFDKDWNPQADIQAQDRCHRIGQTKPVMVYSFVVKNTLDESIFNRANLKKRLETVVLKSHVVRRNGELDVNLFKEMLEYNEEKIDSEVLTDQELDKLLDRSELYEQMKTGSW